MDQQESCWITCSEWPCVLMCAHPACPHALIWHVRAVRPFKSAQLEVMFAMIGRDVAQELPYILRNIERLGERFAVAHVVLVEVGINGSYCHRGRVVRGSAAIL